MATYISLISLTQHGEEDIQHTVERADHFRAVAEKVGATVKETYWTLGGFDGVLIFEAPDDETAATLMLSLGSRGSVRTQTLRAFDRDAIEKLISRIS